MNPYTNGKISQRITEVYDDLAPAEKSVAEFFLKNIKRMDFSSENLSKLLYVSEATLSRFAKKCGYKGYRELIYIYEEDWKRNQQEKDISVLAKQVRGIYLKLLESNYQLLDEDQMKRMARLLSQSKRVCVYGMGSSGFAAKEFQLRFMRTGLYVEAITDSQMMKMSAALLEEGNLVIALSLSGKTKEIQSAIRLAKKQKAKVIFITSNKNFEIKEYCDEILYVATTKDLDGGTMISPQFPMLVMIDIFFAYYFANDSFFKVQKHKETLSALSMSHTIVNEGEK